MIVIHMPNLGGIADGEQPCKHSGVAINGQDPKHPGQSQQRKEDDSGLQDGPIDKRVRVTGFFSTCLKVQFLQYKLSTRPMC